MKTLNVVVRWFFSILIISGMSIAFIFCAPITYEALETAQSLQRIGIPNSRLDGFTLTMCIIVIAIIYAWGYSLILFIRETNGIIKEIARVVMKAIKKIMVIWRRMKKKKIVRLEYQYYVSKISLKRKILNEVQIHNNLGEAELREISDSLNGLSIEDLQDLFSTVRKDVV